MPSFLQGFKGYKQICICLCNYARNNWLNHRMYFTLNFQIKPMKENMARIQHCVKCQLGDKMLKETFRMYNTQKTEIVNKIIQMILTKKKTFAQNNNGRVHSAVSCINNGPGDHDLFAKRCQGMDGHIPSGSKVARILKRDHDKFRKYANVHKK